MNDGCSTRIVRLARYENVKLNADLFGEVLKVLSKNSRRRLKLEGNSRQYLELTPHMVVGATVGTNYL